MKDSNLKLLIMLRNVSFVSLVLKSNIALGLAWYGQFYSVKEVTHSATPFTVAAICSGAIFWIMSMIVSDEKRF